MSSSPGPVTEKAFQAAIIEAARWHGWWAHHHLHSRGSEPGWPDLVLLRPGEAIFAELKSERGKVTVEQRRCLELLTQAGCETHLWRPDDQDLILERLRTRPSELDFDRRTARYERALKAIIDTITTAHAARARRPHGGAVTRCEADVERLAILALEPAP